MKRNRALLGSNPTRDNRLKRASCLGADRQSRRSALFYDASWYALKTHKNQMERSDSNNLALGICFNLIR